MSVLNEIKKGETGRGILIERDGYIDIDNAAVKTINESKSNEDSVCPYPFILPAVFQRYDAENANGRIYPKEVLMREVEKYNEKIKEKRAIAELNHPIETVLDLSRIAINVVDLEWSGNTLVGHIEILTTPGFRKYGIVSTCGDETANLLLNGIKIGLSSRGVGSVKEKFGKLIVQEDYEIICFDVVADPSTHNAWICDSEKIPQAYMESTEKNNPIIEKINKFSNWLNN